MTDAGLVIVPWRLDSTPLHSTPLHSTACSNNGLRVAGIACAEVSSGFLQVLNENGKAFRSSASHWTK